MGVFIIYEEGGDWQMGGGQAEFTPLYRRSERLHSGEEGGGEEKFDGLYPSLFWVLNFCKNCMTFGNCKEFYKFNVLAMSQWIKP